MKPVTVDMNELLAKIVNSLRYQLEAAGGRIDYGSLPPCRADLSAASQLFSNLLDNAVKYRSEDRPLTVEITGEVREGMAFYTVRDNGSGIPEEALQRVWNVFYQPARSGDARKGEGIGLPLVKRITEKNGGSIRVESKEGAGSVFHVQLPAA
jgi:signal transduction histidine kinase